MLSLVRTGCSCRCPATMTRRHARTSPMRQSPLEMLRCGAPRYPCRGSAAAARPCRAPERASGPRSRRARPAGRPGDHAHVRGRPPLSGPPRRPVRRRARPRRRCPRCLRTRAAETAGVGAAAQPDRPTRRCDTSVHLSSALTRALGDWVYDQVTCPGHPSRRLCEAWHKRAAPAGPRGAEPCCAERRVCSLSTSTS